MLKESGPRIKPCGTPEMIFSKELYVLLMRTHCLQNCLQDTAPQVSNKLDIDIESSNIKDCLWIPGIGSKRVFIKFSKRKCTNRIQGKEKNLRGMDLSSVGIRYSIYINDRLCKYCDTFRQKYKKICAKKFFHLFWVSNGSIRLNLSYNDKSYIVVHINDLEELFPENELLREEDCFTFSYVLFFS